MLAAALWVGAWLRAAAAGDDLLDALARLDPDAVPAVDVLAAVRGCGADSAWLVLARPGRTVGWPAGLAGAPEPVVLLAAGDVLVAALRAGRPGWRVDPLPAQATTGLEAGALPVRAAARAFAEVLAEATGRLESLGLARAATGRAAPAWASAVADLPGGLDPQVLALLHRAALVLDALALAGADDGAAVTAGEAQARAAELHALRGRVEDVVAGLVGGLARRPVAWDG
jgi:hypothetical protein